MLVREGRWLAAVKVPMPGVSRARGCAASGHTEPPGRAEQLGLLPLPAGKLHGGRGVTVQMTSFRYA